VKELAANLPAFQDFDSDNFYNIRVFKRLYP